MRPIRRIDASRMLRCAGLALGLLLAPALVHSEVYRWRDAEGRLHYSDKPPKDGRADVVALQPEPPPPPEAPRPAGTPARPSATAARTSERQDLSVVMYTMPNCGYCDRARTHLSRRGVGWQEIDITSSAAARGDFQRQGGRGTPLMFINGTRLQGFNGTSIDRVLSRYGWR